MRKENLSSFDILDVLYMYEDGVHGTPEAIIEHTNYDKRMVYRIIYWYRTNLKPISYYHHIPGRLFLLLKELPCLQGVYR